MYLKIKISFDNKTRRSREDMVSLQRLTSQMSGFTEEEHLESSERPMYTSQNGLMEHHLKGDLTIISLLIYLGFT
jgi:hypothetical protein